VYLAEWPQAELMQQKEKPVRASASSANERLAQVHLRQTRPRLSFSFSLFSSISVSASQRVLVEGEQQEERQTDSERVARKKGRRQKKEYSLA